MTGGANIIDRLIEREGRVYTNRASDRGGPTKFGITLDTLRRVRGPQCTALDVQALTEREARAIYVAEYLEGPGFLRITNPWVQELVVDCGVNHGTGRAAKWLQAAAKVEADGAVGPATLAAVNAADPRELFGDVLCIRNSFYEDLDDADPKQEANEDGWENRVNEFIRMLARMPAA